MVVIRGSITTQANKGKLTTPSRFGLIGTSTYKGKEFTGEAPAPTPPTPPATCEDLYGAEACAVFALMDTDPPTYLKEALATFIQAEVLNGNFALYEQFTFWAMDTLANSVKDWIGAQDVLAVNSPTHTPITESHSGFAGFDFNGVDQYIDSQWQVNTFSDKNNSGARAYVFSNVTDTALFGARQSSRFSPFLTQANWAHINSGVLNRTVDNYASSTDYATERTASNALAFKIDGVNDKASTISVTTGAISYNMYYSGYNFAGNLTSPMNFKGIYQLHYKPVGFDHASFISNMDTLLVTLGIYSSEAATVLGRFTGLTIAQKVAVVKLVHGLEALGVWSNIIEIQSYGGLGTEANGLKGWKGVYNGLAVNSPTWDNAGYTFNGTDNYINSQIIPDFTDLDSCGGGISVSAAFVLGNLQAVFGAVGGGEFSLYRQSNDIRYRLNSNLAGQIPNTNNFDAGEQFIERSDASTGSYYQNGVLRDTETDASTAEATVSVYIGCKNLGGTATWFTQPNKTRFKMIYNGNIDQTELNSLLDTYFSDLGL